MSAPTITRNTHNTLTTLLVPLADRHLLLPNVAVAELTQCRGLTTLAGAPEWILGQLVWRDQAIPLVCFEHLSTGAAQPLETRHVLIINAIGDYAAHKFYALLSQGIPRSIKVDQNLKNADVPLAEFELEAVELGDQIVRIPDLLAIEKALSALN